MCTCSQFPTEAIQWIKEVEMVESVDVLKSSRSIKGTHGPDFEVLDARIAFHRLKTMVKRSIEQNLRMKNFEARNENYETSALVKNQRVKLREQRSQGDCWQWKADGQCSKGDSCSFRHDKDKRAKSTQPNPSPRSSTQQNVKHSSRTKSPRVRSPSGKMARLPCKDYLEGTCTTPFCEK